MLAYLFVSASGERHTNKETESRAETLSSPIIQGSVRVWGGFCNTAVETHFR